MNVTPYEAYKLYLGLKSHFTRDGYDWFKYNGKVSASQSSFESRRDKFYFGKLAKMKDPKGFLIANLLYSDGWIGELVTSEEAERIYTEWQRRNQSLSYVFKGELDELEPDLNGLLTIPDGDHPKLLKLFIQKKVSPETIAIILDLTGAVDHWNKRMKGDPLWSQMSKVAKYAPFVQYDKTKFKELLVDYFSPPF